MTAGLQGGRAEGRGGKAPAPPGVGAHHKGGETMLSCCKPIGKECPWDVLPPWKDITLAMCEACGCQWLRDKDSDDDTPETVG